VRLNGDGCAALPMLLRCLELKSSSCPQWRAMAFDARGALQAAKL